MGFLTRCALLLAVLGVGRAAPPATAVGNHIDDIIRQALETLQANMTWGFPQWGIPPLDPLVIGDVPFSADNDGFTLHGNVSNLVLTDLAQFTIDDIHSNLIALKLSVSLGVPTLTLTGAYVLDGLIAQLFPLYGSGPVSITISNAPLSISADFGLNGTHYQVQNLDFNFAIGALDLQFHGLFDSDPMSQVIDEFADDFGPLLVDILVNDTRRDLIPKLIDFINGLLSEVEVNVEPELALEPEKSPLLETARAMIAAAATADANEYFDRIMANLRQVLLDNGLDPVQLPDETLEILATGIKLHDGHLDGLANVHRTGDAVMSYTDDEWLGISGHIGFNGLGAGYSCKIEVFHIGPDVTAAATITETSVYFAARISSKTLKIELDGFDIENIGHIDISISGLGPFDWLLQPLAEAIVNLLKGLVGDIINLVLKPLLSSIFNSIDIMDILYHLFD